MTFLSRLTIRAKLASMVILAALTVFAIVAGAAWINRNRMLEDRVAQMHTAVDLLYGLAQSLEDDVAAGKMTVAEAKEQFHQRGGKMTFNKGQGYPNAYNIADKSLLLNPANPKIEGKINGTKDANGVLLADAQIAAGRQSPEGGTTSYLYPRPGETEPARNSPMPAASSRGISS